MLKFTKLSIKNFLSYGNSPTVINLDNNNTTLIIGEDLDNTVNGTGANGVGKSTCINALVFALYGKPIANISMDNLVNNINKKNMMVEIEFEINNKIVLVRRARREKGLGNYAKVFIRENTEELNEKIHDKTPDSVNNINAFIEEYVGMPFELFIRVVAFTATHTPFLDMPLRQQSDIMEELFKLTQLSSKADVLKKEIRNSKQSLEIKIKHNEQLELEHERYKTQLTNANERKEAWDVLNKEDIDAINIKLAELLELPIKIQEKLHTELNTLKEKLDDNKTLLYDTTNNLRDAVGELDTLTRRIDNNISEQAKINELIENFDTNKQNRIKKLKTELQELQSVDINQQTILSEQLVLLEAELNEASTVLSNATTQLYTYNEDQVKIEGELKHLEDNKCPYCLQDFKESKAKIKKYNNVLKTTMNDIKKHNELIKKTKNKQNKINESINKTKTEIFFTPIELTSVINNIKKNEEEISRITVEQNPYIDQLTDLHKYDSKTDKKTITGLNKIVNEYDNKKTKQTSYNDKIILKIKDIDSKITIKSITEIYDIKNKIKQYTDKINDLNINTNPYIEPLNELQKIQLDKIDNDSINNLNKLITHQNYLIKLLTKKDSFIRKILLNKNLSFLNKRLKYYLNELGLPHKVEFTQEMTANISQFGRQLDFGNLSSGQKARVNIGLAFAFRDILQQSHNVINICMLDEILDTGLDGVGIQRAATMLKHKARDENLSLYIISHRDEVGDIFDKKMIIQMKNGFSTIKE